ncbi:binding-protein-dependent transport systems inner membrane component [Rhodomicrobium vannielii ATCC 17100]|uniref:Binding-protein-dependent transport systems inner membrane component n=1 Tax=Rhodomicrobium vannielii (strain ATCC 17100 / DSM 162 / LMG 4299 / NCIMB 10020 / ATH 3.1.1) TaxID=648757 RepID=E3HZ56_RHOVT|nr:ABC transporter permease [Rhodomicrobium vannielii]ADP72103.1 binding-protein-dependent transport systems inner membrane component [Rhodomicrobium vannielii ATCC 17100]
MDIRVERAPDAPAEKDPAEIAAPVAEKRGWFHFSPLNQRRWSIFKSNRRGFYSFILFTILFFLTLFAEFIANDKPFLVKYDGAIYTPIFKMYTEKQFGGEFETEADYRDPEVKRLIEEKNGWMVWPLIPYSYRTIKLDLPVPAPAPPSWENWLGTDDQGRDVLARVIYGFRISVLFGLFLTIFSALIGVTLGAIQGYFGGWTDLLMQRFIEIIGSLPRLYILLILSAILAPGFWWLLFIMLLFEWTAFVGPVRAEFLRGRNFEYVRAARALGLSNVQIMFKHILPNAMVATVTFAPFILGGAITALTALDYLGFGLPPGSPSLGELLQQGKQNLQAPWLGLTAFFTIALMLSLLVFVGEAVRDALDPRKTMRVNHVATGS